MKTIKLFISTVTIIVFSLIILKFMGTNRVQAEGLTQVNSEPFENMGDLKLSKNPLGIADIQAAATANRAKGFLPGVAGREFYNQLTPEQKNYYFPDQLPQTTPIDETVIPHYFGPFANYANSPLPTGPVASITIEKGGSGYSADTNVIIVDVYDTGSEAAADAVINPLTGAITDITVTNPGTGYSAPIAVITDVSGSGAIASVILGNLDPGTGIRKFVDALPGLGIEAANALGNYIPVAIPDTTTYPGADYYEIEVGQFTQQLSSDLPATTLRGYRQVNTLDSSVNSFHYLGPLIVSQRGIPVRIKFINSLPTGSGGDLFIPVDPSVMGAGTGALDSTGASCNPDMDTNCASYTQNRATLHLHGGYVPWISDGTPHQWTTPAGENTVYPTGVSVSFVPDMWFDVNGKVIPNTEGQVTTPVNPDPSTYTEPFSNNPSGSSSLNGEGALTFYYNNDQSARLMFYHDHSYGITRLNVYSGEAAGYLITDEIEQDLIAGTNLSGVNPGLSSILPDVGIPLIIQDKTFVDEKTIAAQDPTWRWGTGTPDITGRPAYKTGDLWVPHVFMTIQNPWDATGANAFGRWQYGPWFWPPTQNILIGPQPNNYFDPNCDPALGWCEPPQQPASPDPSMGAESFNDTMLVNGQTYPYVDVAPKVYRFRILNASNDRFLNLQMYVADPTITTSDGRTNTEVKMVPALATPLYPATFPADGRVGGAPDPFMAGPAWLQIGTEGGFLPKPVIINNIPLTYQMNPGLFNVGNALDHSLLLGTAERADVLIDFTPYAGQTIILYNDAAAPFPAIDPRLDYYTGDPAQMDSGGTFTTQPGFGPNTRTILQFRVAGTPAPSFPNNYYNPATLNSLNSIFAKGESKSGVFEKSQDPIIVPQSAYNSAYDATFPSDMSQFVQVTDRSITFTPIGETKPVTFNFEEKAAHDEMGAAYDPVYGHMSGNLGLELRNSNNLTQNIILYGYASPPVEVLKDSGNSKIGTLADGTQIWKITHNGVDTHPIHFHLFNVQVLNRVGWDGLLLPPDPNELGWKETVRMNPLESLIVAMRPIAPTSQPFDIPDSTRLIDPTRPEGVTLMGASGGFFDPNTATAITVTNHYVNFGWEYVWHCHILGHEEMDMMHTMAFAVAPKAPTSLAVDTSSGDAVLTWSDNSLSETGFTIQRASDANFSLNLFEDRVTQDVVTYTDTSYIPGNGYYYRVLADKTIGDTFNYGAGFNFPTQYIASESNLVGVDVSTSFVISGNTGIGGVTLAYTEGIAKSVVSDTAGNYSITVPPTWAGTVSPSKAGDYTFSPTSRTYDFSILLLDQIGQNYNLFTKTVLLNGAVTATITPNLSWKAFEGVTLYEYCVDQSKDNTCDPPDPTSTGWVGIGTNTTATPSLTNGATYFWQVRADGIEANGGAWWSFKTQPGAFNKITPANGESGFGTSTTLSWSPSAGATAYWYCYDLTNNTTCDNPWVRAGTNTSATIGYLTRNKTYFWQVRAEYDSTTPVFADGGSWWSFNTKPPAVSTIALADPNPTTASSVNFTVTFSQPVTGVSSSNFVLTVNGLTGTSISGLGGSGAIYTVTVNTGSGTGKIRLDVVDNDLIINSKLIPLGGPGIGNGNFNAGPHYTLDRNNTYISAANYDGWILESAKGSGLGGSLNSQSTTLIIGDDSFNRQYRSIVSFNTGALPDNAIIIRVTLRIHQVSIRGTDPFSTLGPLLADIRKNYFGNSLNLQNNDFQAAASSLAAGSFVSDALPLWYQMDLMPGAFPFVNLSGPTQFRLRFTTPSDNDFSNDFATFTSGNSATLSIRPVLIVEYVLP